MISHSAIYKQIKHVLNGLSWKVHYTSGTQIEKTEQTNKLKNKHT